MLEALVVRSSPYSESTLLLTLLTREEGVLRVLAKGARRIKGGNAAAFDLFARIRCGVRLPSREGLGVMRNADLEADWPYLRSDPRRLAFAAAGMEILTAVASHSPPEPHYFDEAVRFLDRLEAAAGPGTLTALFLLRLLHHAGHPPRLAAGPGSAVPERPAYDFNEGAVVDGAAPGGPGGRLPLSRRMVEIAAPWLAVPPPLAPDLRLPAAEGAALLRWLVRIWEDHLEQSFRSFGYLEKTVLGAIKPGA